MKGLLIKDFKLMKNQKNFFLLIIVVSVLMAFSTENAAFIAGYLPFLCSLFTLSSISYDEYDNGSAFLFSMPISRRNYAVEKYAFGLLTGAAGWILAFVIAAVFGMLKHTASITDSICTSLVALPVILLALAMMLPLQLKFGGEKGRIVALGTVGFMMILSALIGKFAEAQHLDLTALFDRLSSIGYPSQIAAALILTVLLLLLSCRISISIMEQKEF